MAATLNRLSERVDGSSLAVFRILFGAHLFLCSWIALADLMAWDRGSALTLQLPGIPDLLGTRALAASSSAAFLNLNVAAGLILMTGSLLVSLGFFTRLALVACFVSLGHFLMLDALFFHETVVATLLTLAVTLFVPLDRDLAMRTTRAPDGSAAVARFHVAMPVSILVYVSLARAVTMMSKLLWPNAPVARILGYVAVLLAPLALLALRERPRFRIAFLALLTFAIAGNLAQFSYKWAGGFSTWSIALITLLAPADWPERGRLWLAKRLRQPQPAP